jgi:hypothetical protein
MLEQALGSPVSLTRFWRLDCKSGKPNQGGHLPNWGKHGAAVLTQFRLACASRNREVRPSKEDGDGPGHQASGCGSSERGRNGMNIQTSWVAFAGIVAAVTLKAGDENWDDRFGPLGILGGAHALAVSGSNIARWNGRHWSSLGAGLNSNVLAVAASGSNAYVGGNFTTAGGIAANRVAKWDGRNWTALGSGVNGEVRAIAVSGNDVYVGGAFTTAGGVPASRIARWNGSDWMALGSGLGNVVFALAAGDGEVYAGGAFTNAGDVSAHYVARWDGIGWSALGTGANSVFQTLAIRGPDLLVGGPFNIVGNQLANYYSIWHTGMPKVPRITRFYPEGADSRISFTTVPGQTYAVEWKEALKGGPWTTITSNLSGDGGTNTVRDPGGARRPSRFYRVETGVSP